jgi:hypothetical protein
MFIITTTHHTPNKKLGNLGTKLSLVPITTPALGFREHREACTIPAVDKTGMNMRLPKSVQEIADVIGRERALYLVGQLPRCVTRDKRYPGATQSHVMLYVPTVARLQLDHELVRILGYVDAVKLCRAFGGEILQPASCIEIYQRYRDAQIVRMGEQGMTTADLVATFNVSRETVRAAIRRQNPQEEFPEAANDNAPVKRKARAANGQSR